MILKSTCSNFDRNKACELSVFAHELLLLLHYFKPGVEWYRDLWALNTSPPRNHCTFLAQVSKKKCNEVDYANALISLAKIMLCSQLHCIKVLDLNPFSIRFLKWLHRSWLEARNGTFWKVGLLNVCQSRGAFDHEEPNVRYLMTKRLKGGLLWRERVLPSSLERIHRVVG